MSKAIFITGAGAGIGEQTARIFCAMGWRVGLYDRDKSAVEALSNTLGMQLTHAGYLDVCNMDDWHAALDDFHQWAGQLDVLLNNAGILFSGNFENTPPESHEKTLMVNILGVMNGCHAALPYLLQTPNSRVINMSSASAIYGQACLASYSSSKFAIRGFTEALDIEWKKHNIRVMDIMPLFVQTQMVDGMEAQSVKRLGVNLTPNDVAKVILRASTANTRFAPTHWPVGFSAHVLHRLVGFMPERLTRLINIAIAS